MRIPKLNKENLQGWLNQARIDYFTQFVKAWIPFNAWYRGVYDVKSDREAINQIKSDDNSFRDRLVALLRDEGNEGEVFRGYIGQLHHALLRKPIRNKGRELRFDQIIFERNPTKKAGNSDRRGKSAVVCYSVERGIKPNKNWVFIKIWSTKNVNILDLQQKDGYDLDALKTSDEYNHLTASRKKKLCSYYEEINPHLPINLLTVTDDKYNCYKIGDFKFIRDEDLVCKAIIEALYTLRNVLFHGEITPDDATNDVYNAAYHILFTLIKAL